MAGRATENLPGGSLKYQFVYLKIRIYLNVVTVRTFATWHWAPQLPVLRCSERTISSWPRLKMLQPGILLATIMAVAAPQALRSSPMAEAAFQDLSSDPKVRFWKSLQEQPGWQLRWGGGTWHVVRASTFSWVAITASGTEQHSWPSSAGYVRGGYDLFILAHHAQSSVGPVTGSKIQSVPSKKRWE